VKRKGQILNPSLVAKDVLEQTVHHINQKPASAP
jgi:hypothetical protein